MSADEGSLAEFLARRRCGGRPLKEAVDWACSLIEQGYESEAILLLAGNPQFDSQEQEKLIVQIVRELGREQLLDEGGLSDALERKYVADYYAGRIDGWTLIRHGTDLYYRASEKTKKRSLFWVWISEDAGQHE